MAGLSPQVSKLLLYERNAIESSTSLREKGYAFISRHVANDPDEKKGKLVMQTINNDCFIAVVSKVTAINASLSRTTQIYVVTLPYTV